MLKSVKAVIFDMDGLLIDSERYVKEAWTIAGERLGYEKVGENIYHTLGLNVIAREQYFKKRYGDDFPFALFQQYNREAFQELVQKAPIPVKKGLPELLCFLRKNGYKMAVATSSREGYARECLEKAGILSYIDAAVYGNMVQKSKPDPEIYLKACRLLGEVPADCLALEDSPNGIRAAAAAGIPVIMIPDLVQPDSSVKPLVLTVKSSLDQVIPLFSS